MGPARPRPRRERRATGASTICVARLAPGVDPRAGERGARAVAARLATLHPETNRGWSAELLPLREKWLPPAVRVALSASLGASFFALLVICANVAGLLLAQANARSREMALRAALGAGRARLVRQTITECTVLAAVGGVLGVPAAILLNRWMSSWVPVQPPYLFAMVVDGRAMAFAAIVTLVAGVACGLAPVARNASAAVWETLAGGARAAAGRGGSGSARSSSPASSRSRPRSASAPLLLAKSFLAQRLADHGYRVATWCRCASTSAPTGYQDPASASTFVERTLERIDALPEVESVGATNRLPAGQGFAEARLEVEGIAIEAGRGARRRGAVGDARLLRRARDSTQLDGRGFTAGEVRDGADVAMVSASLAERLWPGESPLGRRVRSVGGTTAGTERRPWLQVIGTVGDIEPVESMVASTRRRLHLYRPWSTRPPPSLTVVVARPSAGRARGRRRCATLCGRIDPAVVGG